MKVNSIIIAAGILALLIVQLFLFRFQKVNDYLILNRYTGTAHIIADLMAHPKEPSESDKIKSLNQEIADLNNKLKESTYDIELAKKIIELSDKKIKYLEGTILFNEVDKKNKAPE